VYQRWTVVSPAQLAGLRAQLRYLAGLWAVTEDCTDRLLMIVNELVSNAVDHARTACEITVRRSRSLVRVLVVATAPADPAA
jgi:two-component sensor histidine kinase